MKLPNITRILFLSIVSVFLISCKSNKYTLNSLSDYEYKMNEIISDLEGNPEKKAQLFSIFVNVDDLFIFQINPRNSLVLESENSYTILLFSKEEDNSNIDLIDKYKKLNPTQLINSYDLQSRSIIPKKSTGHSIEFGSDWKEMIKSSVELIRLSGNANSKAIKISKENKT